MLADVSTARELGEQLSDDPFTFTARSLLLRGAGRAWFAGPPHRVRSIVVQDPWQPTEPRVFGEDPDEIYRLLTEVPGWDCLSCAPALSAGLAATLQRELGLPTTELAHVHYLLEGDPRPFHHPWVRRLDESDLALVEEAPASLRPSGFDSMLAALSGGIVAGAVHDGRLWAVVAMTLSSESFANLEAHTLDVARGQGLCTAAGYLVALEVERRGLEAVWSAGATDEASRRVARKLGFREIGQLTYVVVPELQRTGGYRPSSLPHERRS